MKYKKGDILLAWIYRAERDNLVRVVEVASRTADDDYLVEIVKGDHAGYRFVIEQSRLSEAPQTLRDLYRT